MRIAQVAPLEESVPPKYYGGTERIVSYLTDELVEQGHDITLFASGDSDTKANLVPIIPRALRLDKQHIDPSIYRALQLNKILKAASEYDVIHFHIDFEHFAHTRLLDTKQITTMHGRLDIPDLAPLRKDFKNMPLVSISNNQRLPLPCANWQGTVYHGLPDHLYTFQSNPDNYLAFLGRISPEKGVDRVIEIAIQVGMEIRIAAKVDSVDKDYFEETIKPLLNHPLVNFIGEIGEKEKDEFLGNAYALLFPINWPEPFGLVMIEAMACGTPVIAFRRGSVPEVITDGDTGFIVDDVETAVTAVEKIKTISRFQCRHIFEQRFLVSHMAHSYYNIYQKITEPTIQPRFAV